MIVGVVGHGSDKFDNTTKSIAFRIIEDILSGPNVTGFTSGRSPVGGIDIWSEQIADELGIQKQVFPAKQHKWDAEYGFKQRNLDIARTSDILYVILVRNYPFGYSGKTWLKDGKPFCYHCERYDVPSDHVKSGACWTAWEAKKLDREVYWYII